MSICSWAGPMSICSWAGPMSMCSWAGPVIIGARKRPKSASARPSALGRDRNTQLILHKPFRPSCGKHALDTSHGNERCDLPSLPRFSSIVLCLLHLPHEQAGPSCGAIMALAEKTKGTTGPSAPFKGGHVRVTLWGIRILRIFRYSRKWPEWDI